MIPVSEALQEETYQCFCLFKHKPSPSYLFIFETLSILEESSPGKNNNNTQSPKPVHFTRRDSHITFTATHHSQNTPARLVGGVTSSWMRYLGVSTKRIQPNSQLLSSNPCFQSPQFLHRLNLQETLELLERTGGEDAFINIK